MAPKQIRGRFVSSYQLAITIGILLADIVDAALSDDDRWRLMLGLSIVPGIVLIGVAAIMPLTMTLGALTTPCSRAPWPRR